MKTRKQENNMFMPDYKVICVFSYVGILMG